MSQPTDNSKQPAAKPSRPRFNILYIFLGIWLLILAQDMMSYNRNVQAVPYSQFITEVEKGNVEDVAISQQRVVGTFKNAPEGKPKGFSTTKIDDPALISRLESNKVKFTGVHESTLFRDLLSWILPALIFVFVWLWAMNRFGQKASGGGGILSLGKSKARIYVEKDLKIRFTDVAGVDEGKEELREIVSYLKDPARYGRLGGRMPKGVLLVGPPGTGKTLLARAVAGEAGVSFFSINGSEFVEMFVGLGAARVRDLFKEARTQAPCIVFIDELDALGKARGMNAIHGSSNDEKEQTLNQLLAELDGFDASTGIILLGATNRPEVLDPALLRAGRFDRTVLIDKPDKQGRIKILEIHFAKIKGASDVSNEQLASLTAGFSGADLANLANEAALIATRRGAEEVTMKDCTEAIERLVAGVERKSRVLGADEKLRVAYHEMGHTVVGMATGNFEAVHKVSIIPRGLGALGYTMRRPTEDRYMMSVPELESRLAMLMGGRASEEIFFNEISTGAADDLDKATEIARAIITRYGMSKKLGPVIYERETAPMLGAQGQIRTFNFSDQTAVLIDEEVKSTLLKAEESAKNLIQRYRSVIEEGVQLLLKQETLDETELKALWLKYAPAPLKIA